MGLTFTSSKPATNLVVKGKSRKQIQPLVVRNVNRKKILYLGFVILKVSKSLVRLLCVLLRVPYDYWRLQ